MSQRGRSSRSRGFGYVVLNCIGDDVWVIMAILLLQKPGAPQAAWSVAEALSFFRGEMWHVRAPGG